MRILAIDTATEACSAALWTEGIVLRRDLELRQGHAERILLMVDELLGEAGVSLSVLDAIAFGRGPGSFTGVRLAASVAQGLAFGAGLPVVGISDLRAVAQRMLGNNAAASRVLVCNDARMQEVYWACFERDAGGLMQPMGLERVGPPASVRLPEAWVDEATEGSDAAPHGVGRAFGVYATLRADWAGRLASINEQLLPAASEIAVLSVAELKAGRQVTPGEAVPVYLRDDVARPRS